MGIPEFSSFFGLSLINVDQKLIDKKSNKEVQKKKKKDLKTSTLFEISFDVTIKNRIKEINHD